MVVIKDGWKEGDSYRQWRMEHTANGGVNMKLSFSTLGCPEWSWHDITSTAKDLGYDGIEVRGVGRELCVPRVGEFTLRNMESTLQDLKRLNLTIPVLASAVTLYGKENRKELLAEGREYIDTAQRMGISYVRILGDHDPEPAGRVDDAWVLAGLQELSGYAAFMGVTLLVETNGCYSDTERLMRLMEKVEGVAALWDINHPYRYNGEPPEATIQNLGSKIKHVHMKDTTMKEDRMGHTLMGGGTLPIEECVGRLQDNGYDGFYSLEWVKRWDMNLEEPGIAFGQYVSYMRGL